MKKSLSRDSLFALGLIAVGGYAALAALGFESQSRFYPFSLGAVVVLCGVGLLFSALKDPEKKTGDGTAKVVALAALILLLWGVAFVIGLGYLLSTLLMQAALQWLVGARSFKRILLASLLITLGVDFVFRFAFAVPLEPDFIFDALFHRGGA